MTVAVERALAALVRRVLLVPSSSPGPRPPADLLGVRFWSAPDEAGAVLEDLLGPSTGRATAFGVRAAWPVWETGAGLVAPGLPAPVPRSGCDAAGGAYRRAGDAVLRESAARERPVVHLGGGAPARVEAAFELLWFADRERRRVADGWLEIDDLFAHTRLPATPGRVAGALREPGAPSPPAPLPVALSVPASGRPKLTVGRGRALFADERWRDPAGATAARAGVGSVRRPGGEVLEAILEDDRVVRLQATTTLDGWRLERLDGDDPYDVLEVCADDDRVALRVAPVAAVDLGRAETRRRVAFDLHGLLVSLAEG